MIGNAPAQLMLNLPVNASEPVPSLKGLTPNQQIVKEIDAIQISKNDQLRESLYLRYLVYCQDRDFLPAEDYPDKYEEDGYDEYSIHFGVVNKQEEMIGTVRLVQWSEKGFPMDVYWKNIIPENVHSCAEISRLAIPRSIDRNVSGYLIPADDEECVRSATTDSRFSLVVTMELYIALYQAAKNTGITHLLAAMEKSLARLLNRYHFKFVEIGPEVDYHGLVTPYILDIEATEKEIALKSPRLFERLQRGMSSINKAVAVS